MELGQMLDRYTLGGYEERTHPASVSELRITRKKVKAHDCDLAAELIFYFSRLDSIGGVFINYLKERFDSHPDLRDGWY
jgi:hypothetical protein